MELMPLSDPSLIHKGYTLLAKLFHSNPTNVKYSKAYDDKNSKYLIECSTYMITNMYLYYINSKFWGTHDAQ